MEALAVKRRRVYSVEPNRIAEAAFARKYVSYLLPALTKMKESTESDTVKKAVKYEVDMALVLSAQGSAWSHALKLSLQQQNVVLNNGVLSSSSSSSSASTTTKKAAMVKECDQNLRTAAAADHDGEDGGGGEEKEAMRRLRRLVPGGEEICNDQEMLAELKSYVRCLQMQVNILQCLAQSHSF
ncbi:transcription factor bHLH146-like [Neltuma alba]|uniref:transcription factor bHLH146-like n=1 Tax=Neltuma alba TaxID=207710 RepID=UPI0010A4BF4C|nr:transcription factor bHLH146-like [Prosopis alba]